MKALLATCRTCRRKAHLRACSGASVAAPTTTPTMVFINQCKPCYDAAQVRAKTKGDRKR